MLERIAARVRRLQPEPAKAPAKVVVAVSPDSDAALVSTDWDDAAERAIAKWGDYELLHRVDVHGAAEGECDGCAAGWIADRRDAYDKLEETRRVAEQAAQKLIAQRDAALAELETERVLLKTSNGLRDELLKQRENLRAELDAECKAHEKTRALFFEKCHEVTVWHAAARLLSERETAQEQRALRAEAELQAIADGSPSPERAREILLKACEKHREKNDKGPPEPPRPHGQKGQAMTARGPQPDADRDGSPTLGITAPHGRTKGPEPDAGRPEKGGVLPPHPRPKNNP